MQVRAGLSLQKRRDGAYGYRFTTRGDIEGDRRVADLAYDRRTGRIFASIYDSSGNDAVIEISSAGDNGAEVPGWANPGQPVHPMDLSPFP